MEALLLFASNVAALVGLASLLLSVVVWRFLIPQTSIKALREELDYRLKEVAEKDRELATFRLMRKADVERLEMDERRMNQISEGLKELRSWRYGAEQYIDHLEKQCARASLPHRKRDSFGLDGEENGE